MRRNFFFPTRTSYEFGWLRSTLQVGSLTSEPFISNPPCFIRRSASDAELASPRHAKTFDHFSGPIDNPVAMLLLMVEPDLDRTEKPIGRRFSTISFISCGACRSRKTR